jgi:hypothetical protein
VVSQYGFLVSLFEKCLKLSYLFVKNAYRAVDTSHSLTQGSETRPLVLLIRIGSESNGSAEVTAVDGRRELSFVNIRCAEIELAVCVERLLIGCVQVWLEVRVV